MRDALRTKGKRQQVSTVQSFPSPIAGWNARDPLAQMGTNDAVDLENWFPTPSHCEIRGGSSAYSTGIVGAVETLALYTGMDGEEQLFAVTDTDCYDCTDAGAVVAQTWTDQDDGKYQWLNMGNGTDNWLLMFNGLDLPKYYDGTDWFEISGTGSPVITGVTTTTLISPCQYHGRLYLLQKDSLSFWYLPAGAVGGAATEYDLSSFATKGGYLMWAATWTFDGGDGIDDYIVFMTSEGEAIVYTGTDPSSAVLWARLGTYYLGKPLGRRSYVQYGGDLLAITQEGVFNMEEGLKYARINERVAITDKIKDAFNLQAQTVGSAFGWEATLYPLQNAILFNIPVGLASEQYVVNTITGAWCRFTGWDTDVFCLYNDELYFGGSTVVTKAWTGTNDKDTSITVNGKTAFNSFGDVSGSKRVTMFRPMLSVDGSISYLTDLDVDFSDSLTTGIASYTSKTASEWDAGTWDSATWQGAYEPVRQWSSPAVSVGYYFAGKLKIETTETRVRWIACDYVLEQGGIIG